MKQLIRKYWMFITMLCASLHASAYDFEVDGIYYLISNLYRNEVAVTYENKQYAASSYSGDVVVPSTVSYDNRQYTVTTIGNAAFSDCDKLVSVTIPNTVTALGYNAFSFCDKLASVIIPNSVTTIGAAAFCKCSSLTSISIPSSVTTIGRFAFEDCISLTSITIPKSVTAIGEQAFIGCTNMTDICVDIDNPAYSSNDGVLYDKSQKKLLYWPIGKVGEVNIPYYVTTIGNYAFAGCSQNTIAIPYYLTTIGEGSFANCSSLTSITIPNSVTTIGNYAFAGCSSLTSITIPNDVATIGEGTFANCINLTSIIIPLNSVSFIGESAFRNCSSLTSITIPNSVTTIGGWAFNGCSSLTSITSLAVTPPTCDRSVFGGVNKSNCTLFVQANCIDKYKAADQWKDFASIKEINSVPVNDIRLNKSEITVSVGESFQLSAEILPSNATDKSIIWESSNTEIATVDQTGKVTAVAQGTAVITAKSTDGSNIQAECNINVNMLTFVSDIDMESIRVYSSNTSINLENVPANTLVRILQHNGTEIYRTQSIGETISHDPGFRGVYIVIIGTHSYKISNY